MTSEPRVPERDLHVMDPSGKGPSAHGLLGCSIASGKVIPRVLLALLKEACWVLLLSPPFALIYVCFDCSSDTVFLA